MNFGSIKKVDIANGPGCRVSLFASGCTRHCANCFNPETWDFDYGKPFTETEMDEIMEALAPAHIAGLSLLGGEPFELKNVATLVTLTDEVKKRMPEKTVWVYSGYTWEELLARKDKETWSLLMNVDVLVDGPFVEELKDLGLRFRGSSNQRIIDVKRSLVSPDLVLWEG